jgi:hypothetical protein
VEWSKVTAPREEEDSSFSRARDDDTAPVFENLCGVKKLEVIDPINFCLTCEKNINLSKNQNSVEFTNNSAAFTNNSIIFEKSF